MLETLHRGIKSREKYSENVRHFCFALHYYSRRGYEFVRKTFHNHLPAPKVIQRWYANSDVQGEPGLHKGTLERLKNICEDIKNDTDMICSLVFEEMNIQTQVFWSAQQIDYVGFVTDDFKRNNNDPKRVIAKQALVFLLNGVNMNFEFPVAYFMIDSIRMHEKKELLESVIKGATECGITIANITFDGFASNIPMTQMFEANLDVLSSSFKPYFSNPLNGEAIYVILDPCHMVKWVRNTLAGKQVFYDAQNRKIEWRYIGSLVNVTKETGIRTHKLNKKHLPWNRNEMSVRLAVQTLSQSVATALEFFKMQDHSEFNDADATMEFIRIIDTLFDIFNSRHINHKSLFKKAMNSGNIRVIIDYFEKCMEYFKGLKIEVDSPTRTVNPKNDKLKKVLITKSRNKTAFRGLLIDMHSLMLMYKHFVEDQGLMNMLPTYYLLQDVIEMFFGKIRGCCGFNNNPSVHQFKGAYRKLQTNIRISSSERGNCRIFDSDLPDNANYSNIYFVSCRKPVSQHTELEELSELQKEQIFEEAVKIDIMKKSNHLLDISTFNRLFNSIYCISN